MSASDIIHVVNMGLEKIGLEKIYRVRVTIEIHDSGLTLPTFNDFVLFDTRIPSLNLDKS